MADVEGMFAALVAEVTTLEARYIRKYIPADPQHGPEDYEYDVKAFCLLCHAAFEEFVEGISEAIMADVAPNLLNKKVTLATATLLMAYGNGLDIAGDEDSPQLRCFDLVREALDGAKQRHSHALKDNHGFSVRYLRSILTPVALNVPEGLEIESVRKLADARGSFAHTMAKKAMYGEYKKANKSLAPEEAREIAKDCLVVCRKIKDQSQVLW
jgi:hypothetical protein